MYLWAHINSLRASELCSLCSQSGSSRSAEIVKEGGGWGRGREEEEEGLGNILSARRNNEAIDFKYPKQKRSFLYYSSYGLVLLSGNIILRVWFLWIKSRCRWDLNAAFMAVDRRLECVSDDRAWPLVCQNIVAASIGAPPRKHTSPAYATNSEARL